MAAVEMARRLLVLPILASLAGRSSQSGCSGAGVTIGQLDSSDCGRPEHSRSAAMAGEVDHADFCWWRRSRYAEAEAALDAGWLVAVDADKAEHDLEGVYWLARLSGPAFVVPEDMVHSGQQYCEGWLVAPGQWYKLKQRSERGYELLEPKVWIVVNHMIRLKGLSFRGSQSGPQGRQLRTVDPTTGPAAAGRAHGSGLSFLEEEVHHEILAGAEYAAQEEAEAEAEAEAGNSS